MSVRRVWSGPFAQFTLSPRFFASLRMTSEGFRVTTVSVLVAGCASVARPPGGPERHTPPEIISISVDTNATGVTAGKIDVGFDEVVAEHPTGVGSTLQGGPTLENVVLVSPRTSPIKVSWHRDHITIEPKGGFKPNTTYRLTLLPGITDIRGNVRREATTLVFSTGPTIQPFSILGQVFDWQASAPASLATVEAIANAGTKDSLTYIGIADSGGRFDVGPLGQGKYLMRGFIDADNNQMIGPLEKWDTVTVEVADHRPVVELLAIQRDTAPIGIQHVDVVDSNGTRLRVTLDKPFDPRTQLLLASVTLERADSSEVPIARVMTDSQATTELARPDTNKSRDTTKRPVPAPGLQAPPSTRPPAPRPSLPPPQLAIVVQLAPGAAVKPESTYAITIRGIPNLIGKVRPASYEFRVPKPTAVPAAKPPALLSAVDWWVGGLVGWGSAGRPESPPIHKSTIPPIHQSTIPPSHPRG